VCNKKIAILDNGRRVTTQTSAGNFLPAGIGVGTTAVDHAPKKLLFIYLFLMRCFNYIVLYFEQESSLPDQVFHEK